MEDPRSNQTIQCAFCQELVNRDQCEDAYCEECDAYQPQCGSCWNDPTELCHVHRHFSEDLGIFNIIIPCLNSEELRDLAEQKRQSFLAHHLDYITLGKLSSGEDEYSKLLILKLKKCERKELDAIVNGECNPGTELERNTRLHWLPLTTTSVFVWTGIVDSILPLIEFSEKLEQILLPGSDREQLKEERLAYLAGTFRMLMDAYDMSSHKFGKTNDRLVVTECIKRLVTLCRIVHYHKIKGIAYDPQLTTHLELYHNNLAEFYSRYSGRDKESDRIIFGAIDYYTLVSSLGNSAGDSNKASVLASTENNSNTAFE